MDVSAQGPWTLWPARLWFTLSTLAVRGRFLTGKASFVAARPGRALSGPVEVYDRKGRPLGPRLLARQELQTEMPRTGTQGWSLFCRSARPLPPAPAPRPALVRLECGFCRHLFFVELSRPTPSWQRAPDPTRYASRWFSFMDPGHRSAPTLQCPRCEQSSTPGMGYVIGG